MLILGVICIVVGLVTYLLNTLIGEVDDGLRDLSITIMVIGAVACMCVWIGLLLP